MIRILLAATLLGGLNMSQLASAKASTGFPETSDKVLLEVKSLINSGDSEKALKLLSSYKPSGSKDKLWQLYFAGVASLSGKGADKGLEKLEKCYANIRDSKSNESDDFRIAGMCLKKIGWYYRSKKDYHKAVSFHNARLRYVKEHGSPMEVHDALISLDVDAYYLGDMYLSASYLNESLEYAPKIKDPKNKAMALATSYNNLAGSQYSVNLFSDAESSIKTALEQWQNYEKIAGEKENKVVWAHFGIADVYEAWAKHLKKSKGDHKAKKVLSVRSYEEAIKLANKRKMPEKDLSYLNKRLSETEKL